MTFPVILLPGMGADSRMFAAQKERFPQLLVPPWPALVPREPLRDFAARLASSLDITRETVLGGASMGGMVALEIARLKPPRAVVLLGSCRNPAAVPGTLALAERAARLIPNPILDLFRVFDHLALARLGPLTPVQRALQVHNSFLVTQDEHGVLIVDQHALHERVMFEALLARVTDTSLESQQLLTPVIVDAAPAQIARLDELAPLLERIGIEASPLGPRQIAVRAFPTFLFDRNVDPGEFLPDLFEKAAASDFAPGSEDALRDVLDMMACKAAVKAGDRMSDGELSDLLKLREAVERSSNCPHGRPTTVRLTIRELEKLFGRA